MEFIIRATNEPQKFLKKCTDSKFKEKFEILKNTLKTKPYPADEYDLKKLKGQENVYRIRIGKYRVIYEVRNNELVILIIKIDLKSDNTYK